MKPLKTKTVELSEFESDMVLKFCSQPKDMPIPSGLCRAINRRLNGEQTYGKSRIQLRLRQQSQTHVHAAVTDQ